MSEEARKAEARGDNTATIDWRGASFEVPVGDYDDLPVDFIEAVEDGRTVGIVRGALGARQWRRVQQMGLKMRELSELADLIASAMGFGSSGESQASSD